MTRRLETHQRLPIALSATALVVALFGSTPAGHAVASKVPPFAKHAKTADYATKAGSVNGIKASKEPRAGQLVPLGTDGRFPASVGVGVRQGRRAPRETRAWKERQDRLARLAQPAQSGRRTPSARWDLWARPGHKARAG